MDEEVHRINLGFVNAFLVKAGDGSILFDTGTSDQFPQLEKALLEAGSLPDHLKLVILTHGDFDHSGNCAELQGKYHVKIAMHAGDVEMIRNGTPAKRHARGWLRNLLMAFGGRFMRSDFHRFEPDILLEDGQNLAEYGLNARVMHTPGHTKGSIVILTASGQLIVGDIFANWRKPAGPPLIENEQELQASVAALKGLKAQMVYPGHGKPFAYREIASIRV